jgi:FemAB-related protein (PEP-CTERM system-associated)
MRMDISLLTPGLEKQWDDLIANFPDATLAHDFRWRNVVERTYHHIPYYLMALQDGILCGILPLFLIRSKLFGRFLTTAPYIGDGGLLADDVETAGNLVDAAQKVAAREMAKYVEIRGRQRVNHGLQPKEKYCIYCLSLDADPGVVWDRLEKRARTAVRKATKCGLAVEWGSHLLSDFVDVESRLMRDLGTPCHREQFYRNILEEFAGRAEICMVRYRERFIGGGLIVAFKKTIAWQAGGCLRAYRDMAGMNLLTWEIIRHGCQEGAAFLDFGRSQWDSGTALFKRQWGARPLPLFYEYHLARGKRMADMDPNNPKFRLPIEIWKRLPMFVARTLGPMIIKDIP